MTDQEAIDQFVQKHGWTWETFVAGAVQLCLEAICAEEGHDWPRKLDGKNINGVPTEIISGTCRRCGSAMEVEHDTSRT